GDWIARGLLQEANAFSKGSHRKRVKFLRFSSDTGKLLRRYFDEERRLHDPNGYILAAPSTSFNTFAVAAFSMPLKNT
ncbi:MAG: hypothetical protein J2P36_04975, partial [Ktedonobacteraceae bacterium]|nr:hypothetical protein [Ktedonobacteraceae bacterium]